jgi:RNA polymerase sigma-70 factor (ECF subfamily)
MLVERYQQPIGGYLARMLNDPEEALDLTQETFVRAYQSIGQTGSVLLVRPWLFRIATNLARDYLRRHRRFAWLPLRVIEDRSGDNNTSSVEEREPVHRTLQCMSPDDRAVLLLCGLEDLSYGEASVVLGGSPEAVRKRFQRAKDRFRGIYDEIGRDEWCEM